MCTNPDSPWPACDGSFSYDYDSIIKRLVNDKDRFLADDSIYITGGEPTIHPDFLKILDYLFRNFPRQKIKLLTNGRRFMYDDFARKVLSLGLNFEIDLSLYGADEADHDAVTRSRGSFTQTTAGLANILRFKDPAQLIGVRFVITGMSYTRTGDFLQMLIERSLSAVDRIVIVFWEAEAQAVKNKKAVKVDFAAVEPYIEKAWPFFKKFRELRLYHFPLCTLPEKFWPYIWRTLPESEITFLPACSKCCYKNLCLGIQKTYLEHVDSRSFKPIKRKIKIEESGDFYKPVKKII